MIWILFVWVFCGTLLGIGDIIEHGCEGTSDLLVAKAFAAVAIMWIGGPLLIVIFLRDMK